MKNLKTEAEQTSVTDYFAVGTRFLEMCAGFGIIGLSYMGITPPQGGGLGAVLVMDGLANLWPQGGGNTAPRNTTGTGQTTTVVVEEETGTDEIQTDSEEDEVDEEENKGNKKEKSAITWKPPGKVTYDPAGFLLGTAPFNATTDETNCIIVYVIDGKKIEPHGNRIKLKADEKPYKIKVCLHRKDDKKKLLDETGIKDIEIEQLRVIIDWQPPSKTFEVSGEKKIPQTLCNATTNPLGIALTYEAKWGGEESVGSNKKTSKKNTPCKIKVFPTDTINCCGAKTLKFAYTNAVVELTDEQELDLLETDGKYLYEDDEGERQRIRASWIGFAADDTELFEYYTDPEKIGGALKAGQVVNICTQERQKAGGHYIYLGCEIEMYHYSKGNGKDSATAWSICIGKTHRVVGIGCHASGTDIYNAYFPYAKGQKLFKGCNLKMKIVDKATKPPI